MTMTKSETTARAFLRACQEAGFTVSVNDRSIVTIHTTFDQGDNDAFIAADGTAPGLLAMLPVGQPGSVWGTDGGSVGGAGARDNGYYTLKKSGVQKRILTALNRLLANPGDGRWLVQLSKGKGRYKTRHATHNEQQALHLFNGYNVWGGNNKRLIAPDGSISVRVLT